MKHWYIYIVLTAAVVLTGSLPFASDDVGRLRPVETAFVRMEAGRVYLETDTGDTGSGVNWDAAMADLRAGAPGSIFLGTASYLLLEDSALPLLPELLENRSLNPGCAVCVAPAGLDLEKAGKYLDAHEPEMEIRAIRANRNRSLPRLTVTDGRLLLVQPGN